uniref:Uncharacterized protein n=1 Tax=Arundo donax TaxID=35708 RepID=A0A0A8ZKT3_ARUDO
MDKAKRAHGPERLHASDDLMVSNYTPEDSTISWLYTSEASAEKLGKNSEDYTHRKI